MANRSIIATYSRGGTDLAKPGRVSMPDMQVLVISGYADAKRISAEMPRLTKPVKQSDLAASLAPI